MEKSSKKGSTFLKQAAILATAGIIVRFIGFLYRVPMTAIIGDRGNAIYSAGYQVYNFLLILSSAGLPSAIGKMVSERIALREYKNAHKVFKVSLAFSGTLGFIFMLLLIFFAKSIAVYVCKIPDAYYTLITLAPTIFIVGIMSVVRGYFQGMNNMVPTAISQIIEQVFNAIFSVVLAYVLINRSVALSAAGGTAGTGIGAFSGFLIVLLAYGVNRKPIHKRMRKNAGKYKIESNWRILKILLMTAVPIIIGTAVYSITNLVDMSMVMSRLLESGAFTANQAESLYGQLQGKYVTLTTLPVAISTAVATASIPNIASSMVLNDRAAVQRKINMSIKISMIISIPAAIGMAVLADQILYLLFPSVPEGGSLLKIGSISIIFLALSQIVTGTLQGIGKVQIPAINAVFGAVVKIVLNYFLIIIPSINVKGAVISTIFCYIVASGLNLLALVHATKFKPDMMSAFVKPLVASLIMGAVCWATYKGSYMVTHITSISTVISILVGMIVYFVFMLFIKGITKNDIYLIPAGRKIVMVCEKFNLL
ncbi:MAG: polysaccharide biosynthesis protein [Clostridia bacterium]|jgi:stage V sporulation protein B|nr:polysaccharide biosynthesis protein [Clostridia bacterium]MCI2000125.1 polysaccharide biosynthesis protein [Clostridia bacterium]MCI2014710.1 polysaccharide biosynthesis protein [Clostridia bacterium]